ncbi:hypothetical protein BV22DRAFT_666847 [Leucogyrophana mollusca]|uniref:Uncharacterized protein n=1 Tax=Leucogyrophana mollusca TaxID=85980 RepID=A0ACB8BBR1_9AGAM|nr:hypothetical protein BV22DRAFT_666847 [Leucogyrophana mollusca]
MLVSYVKSTHLIYRPQSSPNPDRGLFPRTTLLRKVGPYRLCIISTVYILLYTSMCTARSLIHRAAGALFPATFLRQVRPFVLIDARG